VVVAAMPPLSNIQRVHATIALMRTMLLFLGIMHEMIVQEQFNVRLLEEDTRKRRLEELNEQLQLVFDEDRLIRRDADGEPVPRKKRRKSRYDWALARANIQRCYYGPNPIFDDKQFARTFRIKKAMADELLTILGNEDKYFRESHHNLTGAIQIDPKAKLLITLKMLGYGVSSSAFLDFFQMGERTAMDCMNNFCRLVRKHPELNARFLRKMTRADAKRVSDLHLALYGIAGIAGSLDCMHAFWKNCPMAHRGVYAGKDKFPSMVLEAVADHNLFFWHAAFGFPGTHNDINILEQSPLLKDMLDGTFHRDVDFDFAINGQRFFRLFYLADGIYPSCSRFCKSLSEAIGPHKKAYASWQEGARKDIERAFGVLQRKFGILRTPFEQLHVENIKNIVYTTLILHNWMVTERVNSNEEENGDFYEQAVAEQPLNQPEEEEEHEDQELEGMNRDNAEHEQLQRFVDTVDGDVTPAITQQLIQRKALYHNRMVEVAHHRWAGLYDGAEHIRLRDAIMNQLSSNNGVTETE
jgi:Plant transposon protein